MCPHWARRRCVSRFRHFTPLEVAWSGMKWHAHGATRHLKWHAPLEVACATWSGMKMKWHAHGATRHLKWHAPLEVAWRWSGMLTVRHATWSGMRHLKWHTPLGMRRLHSQHATRSGTPLEVAYATRSGTRHSKWHATRSGMKWHEVAWSGMKWHEVAWSGKIKIHHICSFSVFPFPFQSTLLPSLTA